MIGSLLLLVILLALSAGMSSSETVLFGLTRHELRQCRGSRHPARRLAAELMTRPRRVLLTILIGNTTVNVLIFASSFVISGQLARSSPVWASLWGVITVILVIVVGEVLAKSLAISMRFALAPLVAPPVQLLQLAFTPVRVIFDVLLVTPLSRLLTGPRDPAGNRLQLEELQTLVGLSRERGVIGPDENDMLQEVVGLATTRVRSIMVPRVDIVAFDLRGSRADLLFLLTQRGLTKVPVYDRDIDHVVGLIHIKDLHVSPKKALRKLITPLRFVPEQITVDRLLVHFRETATQLAIVVDEYGGVAGLVTLEDVVEEIVGNISEPGEVEPVQQLDAGTFRMSGDVSIEDWGQMLGRPVDVPRVTTLGGLVAALLERPPREGDAVRFGNVRLRVEDMRDNRVQWVRVELAEGDT